ncbi:MAG: PepSY domain-containing protein [Oscillospiraceae bacterium]|nr:PepSY domain-containing protein [Oscillospiraceae bacterium]
MKKMKKWFCFAAVLTILLLLCCTGAYAAEGPVDQDGAKAVALADAGLEEKDVSKLSIGHDREDGREVYEVKFRADGVRYEYSVEAESGRILEREIKRSPDTKGKKVDLEAAKKIALQSAGLQEDGVVFTKAKQEKDDGRRVFDIEFYVEGERVCEFEIDCQTGTVLEEHWELWDADDDRTDGTLPGSKSGIANAGDVIDLEEAEAIALKNAGKNAEEVVFKKAKLEKDDGRLVYEIKFYEVDGFEYEYEIDALTGELLGFERERWDGD